MTVAERRRPEAGLLLTRVRQASVLLTALLLTAFFERRGVLPIDLNVYREGGSAVLHGRDLYGPSVQVQGYPFTYPPFAAILFVPLAVLPPMPALAVMCAGFYVCLTLVIRYCAPGLLRGVGDDWTSWLTVLMILASDPVRATLKDGQVNMLLAALVLTDLLSTRRGRGLGTGIAAAIKLTPAVFLVYLLATRQWRTARNVVLGFLGCTALAGVLLPSDSRTFWARAVFDTTRVGDSSGVSNQSLSGLVLRAAGHGVMAHVVWVLLAGAAAVLALLTARRLHVAGREALALGVVGVLGCLLSPVTWPHHWVWVVPVLLGVIASPAWRHHAVRVATIVACAVFLYGFNGQEHDVPVFPLVLGNPYTLTALLGFAAAACAMRGSRRVAAARGPRIDDHPFGHRTGNSRASE